MTQTPLSAGLVARVTQAARYVLSGVAPDGWFGPLQPLEPIAPPSVAGRRFDYPTGYNLNYNPRSYEAVSFEELRALADSCDILRSVIETRKDQVEAQEWTIRVRANDNSSRVPVATDDQKQRIDAILQFLHSPDREHGFDQWLRLILEDMFVIDGVALYKRRNRAGGLFALEVMDAATIKLLIDDSGRSPVPPDPAYQQILKGIPAADYTREELMYLVHNPRSHKIYGYSHVEQVLVTVNILIRRSLHQLEYYREGSAPDAFVGLPKEWTQDQINDFQKHFDAMLAGNSPMRRHLRFMPGDFKYQETKAPPLKDAYDEYLARIICFVFSISPEPFVGLMNRATAESSQSRAQDEGLAPLLRIVRSLMNRIIVCEFASPDLEFAWSETRAQDPAEAAQIDVAYVGAGILTADEVRANMGLAPLLNSFQHPLPQVETPKQVRGEASTGTRKVVKKKLRKEDDGDDEPDDDSGDDDDDSSDDGDPATSAGSDDFDDKHPRWPGGTPGDIGGQFRPKDESDATSTLHDAISEDAGDNSHGTEADSDTTTQLGPVTPVSLVTTEAVPVSSQDQQGTDVADNNNSQNDTASDSQDPTFIKKQNFTDAYLADAEEAAQELGVPVENILALAALESGWGEGRFAEQGNNFFGQHYPAPYATGYLTAEDSGAKVATFASFNDSLQSFISQYGYIVQGVSDPTQFATVLQNSGNFGINLDGTQVPTYVSSMVGTINHLSPFIQRTKQSQK